MIDFERYAELDDVQRAALARALRDTFAASGQLPAPSAWYAAGANPQDRPGFSLFFFADQGGREAEGLYDLLLRSASIADEADLEAVWLPERHFHKFGGPYPNPSVLAAAVARTTRRIGIRAGSVVLPLHNLVRVLEEWSVIDNLSGGRVGLSIASGWHPGDFEVLSLITHRNRRFETERLIRMLHRGWLTRSLASLGYSVDLKIYPMSIQPILPLWCTSSKNPATWKAAGRLGSGVLTGLMEQSFDELAANIAVYRTALEEAGHDVSSGKVTLMVHTFLADDAGVAADVARPALTRYLRDHMHMYEGLLRQPDQGIDLDSITEADRQALIGRGIDRYLEHNSLIGSIDSLLPFCTQLTQIGVDEFACLIDFGIPSANVLASVERIAGLARRISSSTLRSRINA
jgi:natural product biosynthesis luciferase-like monooxygenase protein